MIAPVSTLISFVCVKEKAFSVMELTENSMEVDTLAGEGLENIFPEDGGDCFGRFDCRTKQ